MIVFTEGGLTCCGGKVGSVAATVERMARGIAGGRKVRWTILVAEPVAEPGPRPEDRSGMLCGVVPDADGEWAKRHNAYFTPRIYVLRDGKLWWTQSSPSFEDLMPERLILHEVHAAPAGM